MNIMLVDDEQLALLQLERMLNNIFSKHGISNQIHEIRSFQLVSEALTYAKKKPPDLVFLDIQMPEITGLEAAEYFQNINQNTEIIFITAFDQFAVKAFELNALDYLLKPVSADRLDKALERALVRYGESKQRVEASIEKPQTQQKIYCFNHIRFQVGDQPIVYPKWRTAKAQELFAFLLHHRGTIVSKYSIMTLFSPELDHKRAMTQLYTVIYQIRKCIKEANLELRIDNDSIQEGYCLQLENTVLDVELWENAMNGLSIDDAIDYDKLEELLLQYEGDYMGNYEYLWAENERERLRQLWNSRAKLLIEHLYHIKDWTRLANFGERLIGYSPYEFDYGVYMMEAYDQLGKADKLVQFYTKQEQLMKEELDLPLPEDMINWYERWQQSRKSIYKV